MSWSGRQVLVTGGGGFIGSHLTERLAASGARVRALVHYSALGGSGWLRGSPCAKDIEIVAGDITDSESVTAAVRGVEVVFHLAALIAIPYSYHSPDTYLDTNIKGTLNIVQAARETKAAKAKKALVKQITQ